jgi:hypothetical protein
MTARIYTAIGRHSGRLVRAVDIIYMIAAFGALGSLPLLGSAVIHCAGWLRHKSARRGQAYFFGPSDQHSNMAMRSGACRNPTWLAAAPQLTFTEQSGRPPPALRCEDGID